MDGHPRGSRGKGRVRAVEQEAFCGVLATVVLDCCDPLDYLAKAVSFANESCWGTLSCTMLLHPSTRADHAVELDRAIASLRYGAIGVNAWSSLAYALVSPTWGALPRASLPEDIQSGSGVVHNTFMFDYPQKSVVYAPFRMRPKPGCGSGDHRNLLRVGRRLTALEARPSLARLAGVALEGLRG